MPGRRQPTPSTLPAPRARKPEPGREPRHPRGLCCAGRTHLDTVRAARQQSLRRAEPHGKERAGIARIRQRQHAVGRHGL